MNVSVRGVSLEISFWFAAVMTLMLLLSPQTGAAECFLLCILHEFGHLAPMLLFRAKPKKIQLGYFGMKIVTGQKLLSPIKEIIIAASGPAVNLTLAAILFLGGYKSTAMLSLGLGLFNLLPVPSLDGGRILTQLTENRKVLKIAGFVCCGALLLFGIAAICSSRNFTFIAVSLYLLIGMLTFS